MRINEKPINPEPLLTHTGWMKGLARSLVVDEALANDVVQETLLAAVRTPPRNPEASKSWLKKVLRNFAYRTRKQEHDRSCRERLVARPERISTTPDELVERAELHREIVDMVLQLNEPHRSTVLLRFFEGLAPREIARRQDVPVTTVRSRLTNALEQLRRRLDRKYGGDRRAWHLAIAPLSGLERISSVEVLSSSTGGGLGSTGTTVSTVGAGSTASSLGPSSWIGAIVMTKKALFSLAAAVALVAGVGIGIARLPPSSRTRDREEISRLQKELREARSRLQELAGSAESGRQSLEGNVPTGHREQLRGDLHDDDRGHQPEEENPFQDMSAADIVSYLNGCRPDDNPQFQQAVSMLCALARGDPKSVLPLLSSVKQYGVMRHLCRDLVSHGGEEALNAVISYITDSTANMDWRREAIFALGDVLPEARALARIGLNELMTQRLPRELQPYLCNAYGEVYSEISKDQAFQNLMGLLNNPACRVRPEFLVERAEDLGTPEDTSAFLSLLGRSWTRETEAAILRAAARTSGSGEVLLDLLKKPPEGVARETIANALADTAEWSSLDNQTLIDAIKGESNREVRAELARALVRSGGEGTERLLELAMNPDAGIDPDSLARALTGSKQPELVPTMAELLAQVKDRGTVHRLARSIAEAGGREGIDTLLAIIADERISPDRFYLLSDGISQNGRPEDAMRLFELLEGYPNKNGADALLETAYELAGTAGTDHCLSLLREAANGHVRAAAAEVLGDHGAGQYLPELVEALGREEFKEAQWRMARAIASAGPDGIIQLGEIMKWDSNTERKSAILEVLSRDHINEAVDMLREALARETNRQIRAKISEAIAKADGR